MRNKSEETRKRDIARSWEWQKNNIKNFTLKLNKVTDKEIIELLEHTPNKTDYIRQLILKDMKQKSLKFVAKIYLQIKYCML